MNDTSYFGGIVKILEAPTQKMLNNNILVTKIRAQIPQFRSTRLVTLKFWGNLARDVVTYYKVNDSLIIEGYLALCDKKDSNLMNQKSKKIEITVLKAYPLFLNYDRSIQKF